MIDMLAGLYVCLFALFSAANHIVPNPNRLFKRSSGGVAYLVIQDLFLLAAGVRYFVLGWAQ